MISMIVKLPETFLLNFISTQGENVLVYRYRTPIFLVLSKYGIYFTWFPYHPDLTLVANADNNNETIKYNT